MFNDASLLELALTHRSYCAENENTTSNERLEFLGDAVLGVVVTDHIYSTYPKLAEGQLAKLRSSVVNTATLAELAAKNGLGPHLRLGRGENQSGGRQKESILADACEAVIGAIYVDAGYEAVTTVVLDIIGPSIVDAAAHPGQKDYKTQLQELTARESLGTPVYEIDETGPDHDKTFIATTLVEGTVLGQGSGTSKKRAEQVAAQTAYEAVTSLVESNRGTE